MRRLLRISCSVTRFRPFTVTLATGRSAKVSSSMSPGAAGAGLRGDAAATPAGASSAAITAARASRSRPGGLAPAGGVGAFRRGIGRAEDIRHPAHLLP